MATVQAHEVGGAVAWVGGHFSRVGAVGEARVAQVRAEAARGTVDGVAARGRVLFVEVMVVGAIHWLDRRHELSCRIIELISIALRHLDKTAVF